VLEQHGQREVMKKQKLIYFTPQTLDEQQQEALEQAIIAGCRESVDIYLEIQREFEPLDTEAACAYDSDAMKQVDQALKIATGLR
jgi:hypothetical protein